MSWEHLSVAKSDATAVVTLNRPPVNAVSQAMYEQIRDLFGRFDEVLPDVKAVVLTGAGKHFCAGNDLDEFLSLDEVEFVHFASGELIHEHVAAIGAYYDAVGTTHPRAHDFGLSPARGPTSDVAGRATARR